MRGNVTYLNAEQVGMTQKTQLPCADQVRGQSPRLVAEQPKEPTPPPKAPTAEDREQNGGSEKEEVRQKVHLESKTESELVPEKESVPESAEKVSLPPYKVITHSLKYEWALWGLNDKAAKRQRWTDNLNELGRFDTVEDFWLLFDNSTPVGQLSCGNDYFLFKQGIMPSWEHPVNSNGGRWLVLTDSNQIDAYWMEVVKACVGAQFGPAGNEAICGVVASVRMPKNANRVALWIRDAKDEQNVARIGSVFKEKVNRVLTTQSIQFLFESHRASEHRSKRA